MSGFNDHIIYVRLYCFAYLGSQTCLNHALICCAGVFESEGHCVEAEWAVLCFLDAYSGYHQIKMAEKDQDATAFITPYGPFCFNTMPFGLKNAGATYQRMIQTCLATQIGKTVEAYVDDVVVKTKHVDSLIDDLRLTFDNLRTYDIKLNPEKMCFRRTSRKAPGLHCLQ